MNRTMDGLLQIAPLARKETLSPSKRAYVKIRKMMTTWKPEKGEGGMVTNWSRRSSLES